MNATGPGALDAALRSHVRGRVRQVGRDYAAAAFAAGLAVTRPDGTRHPIPAGALPVFIDDDEAARRAVLARDLVAATAKAAAWRLRGPERAAILAALRPVERRLVQACEHLPVRLAVARVDFLGASALEVNATIPAMQGYSDIAVEQWLRHFGPAPQAAQLAVANGSNAAALRSALLQLHERLRRGVPQRVALLCRRGDAQATELARLAADFERAGLEARIVHPDQLEWRDDVLWHGRVPLPLVYRHVFLSRLEQAPSAALEAAMTAAGRDATLVLNPPAPHLEMKSTLACLSLAAGDDALSAAIGLEDAERAAVAACVPWTRRLATLDPQALAEVAADPERFVLKRSWSYGGHDVFVGRAHAGESFRARVARAFPGVTDWRGLCLSAAGDTEGEGFVVQRAVAAQRAPQWLCTPDAVASADVVTDFACYASLGAAPDWQGVCRAATDDVVNIVGGGGVVPLLRSSVARRVLAAGDGLDG